MSVLVLVEHNHRHIQPATASALSAALALDKEVSLLVAGHDCEAVVKEAAQLIGVKQVLWADHPCYQHPLAENLSALLHSLVSPYGYILAAATTFGRNVLPRLAALLDVGQVSEVTKIIAEDTFEHPIYAGNAIERVRVLDEKKVLTIRATAFVAAKSQECLAPIEKVNLVIEEKRAKFLSCDLTQSKRPELSVAKRIVSGGRGLQSAEKFKLIEELADSLGASVGASRAAVDAGFVSNDYQVGQTGKVVAPELYIAVGISGALQHLAGMKDSKIIVAINKDPDAPIFKIADYGLVGDLFQILPQLIAKLRESL